jgi:anti-sigma-K factor RskA
VQTKLNTVLLAKSQLEHENNLARLQIAQLSSSLEEYRQATALVIWDATKQRGLLKLTKLPPAPHQHTYQLWALDPHQAAPVPSDVFAVSAEGTGDVFIKAQTAGATDLKFAISVEPEGGSTAPRGPVIFVGP